MDKGYQGAKQQVQAIIPKKKSDGQILPLEDEVGMQQWLAIKQ